MIGLLLIYFIGKSFYALAHEHGRSEWGFAILGVISYYAGTFLAGITFGILAEAGVTSFFIDLPDLVIGLFAMPFGIAACWGLYRILENQWSKEPSKENDQTLDGGFMTPKS